MDWLVLLFGVDLSPRVKVAASKFLYSRHTTGVKNIMVIF